MARIKIKQHDITDCGAACLASISAHYKLQLPIAKIRQYASTDKKGTNILGLIEAATKLGFEAKGVRGDQESLFMILNLTDNPNKDQVEFTMSFLGETGQLRNTSSPFIKDVAIRLID